MKKTIAILAVLLIGWMTFALVINTKYAEVTKSSQTSSDSEVLPPSSHQVEVALNKWRESRGLSPFNSEVPALDEAAQARADRMCTENDWTHNKDWEVLDQYYSYNIAGENLYLGSLRADQVDDAITSWANSPGHLANMVKDYTEVGIGVKYCPGYQNYPTAVIITNYFGVPR